MILDELCKKDKKWRQIAYKICGDRMLADDIVQDAYIKVRKKEKVNEFYFVLTMNSIYIDYLRNNKTFSIEKLNYLKDSVSTFELNDKEQEIINNFYKLKWHQQEFILESFDRSYREIEKQYNINYGFIYREVHKGISKILKKDYNKYNNSNLKHLRNGTNK